MRSNQQRVVDWEHAAEIRHGCHHVGILISSQRPIGDLLRLLLHLAGKRECQAMRDRLEFLGKW